VFAPPNILFIKDFDFERINTETRNKYMIVILQTNSDAIIAPLTTSVDYVPEAHKGPRCIHDVPSRLHCYCMPDALVVGKNGFSFPKYTYVQVQGNLAKRSVSDLKERYQISGMAQIVDELTDKEYSDLLYCIYKSEFVPRGIRRAIEPIIEQLEKSRIS
jgi:hypothetical protein